MLKTTSKAFIAFLGVIAFVVAGNNALALVLWLWLKFAWWPLLAPTCLYTSNGLPAPPPQDYVINLIVFAPLSWLAWIFARRNASATTVQTSPMEDSAWRVLRPLAKAVGVAAALYVILRYLCDFSVRQSVVLDLLGYLVFELYASQRSRRAFSPFRVVIQPNWHPLLWDFKLVNNEEEGRRFDEAIGRVPASEYNVYRSGIFFTVIAPPSDEGWPPGLTWNNRNEFRSTGEFSETLVGFEDKFITPDTLRAFPDRVLTDLFSPALKQPKIYFKWGRDGYELGLDLQTQWWKHLCETGEIGDLANVKAQTVNGGGSPFDRTRLVLATLPYSEFSIYYRKKADYFSLEDSRDNQLRASGWERGEYGRAEQKYFRVSHSPV